MPDICLSLETYFSFLPLLFPSLVCVCLKRIGLRNRGCIVTDVGVACSTDGGARTTRRSGTKHDSVRGSRACFVVTRVQVDVASI